MDTLEAGIVRSHTEILQVRNSLHSSFRHILLSQNDCQFFRTVVTVVEEDNHVALFDSSHRLAVFYVYDRFDEFVRYTFCIRFFHRNNHIFGRFACTVHDQVVGFFHTFPTFVTVHSIVTSDDRRDLAACRL